MKHFARHMLAWLGLTLAVLPASATFHLWTINEIYSNADGTVQFIELTALAGGQEFTSGHPLIASSGGVRHTYNVTSDLPGDSAGRRFLFGTVGFAALNIVQPDYIIPNNFIFPGGGSINWADADIWNYGALPTDGELSLNRSGVTGANSPANFAGMQGHIQTATTPTTNPSYQGLWWKSPANSESGWGANLTHQGKFIFVTWFTYDMNGNGLWLAVLLERVGTTGATFAGSNLYSTTAAPFNAQPWDSTQFHTIPLGNAQMTFTDANNGSFTYSYTYTTNDMMDDPYGYGYSYPTVHVVTQTKAITRQIFAPGAPECFFTGGLGNPPNYSDLWWKSPPPPAAESENGWGVNLTHQGNFIFATWFTYDLNGNGMWLAVVATPTATPGQFSGSNLYRTRGAPLIAEPWDASLYTSIPVGSATFTFTDASNGTFTYTVNGVTQTKAITRQVFASPVSVCR